MPLSAATIVTTRPDLLRLVSLDVSWVRLDAGVPATWSWEPFPRQRNRFDAPGWRVRYAARTERGAFRERFADRGRVVRGVDASVSVVVLTGRVRVVDLRNERTLDLLGVDGEICTGRSRRVFEACSLLTSRLLGWYGVQLHGIVYTSRTTPQSSANLAFFRHAPVRAASLGRLDTRRDLLAELIADDGFRIDLPDWV
jgi:hypothetical protein